MKTHLNSGHSLVIYAFQCPPFLLELTALLDSQRSLMLDVFFDALARLVPEKLELSVEELDLGVRPLVFGK